MGSQVHEFDCPDGTDIRVAIAAGTVTTRARPGVTVTVTVSGDEHLVKGVVVRQVDGLLLVRDELTLETVPVARRRGWLSRTAREVPNNAVIAAGTGSVAIRGNSYGPISTGGNSSQTAGSPGGTGHRGQPGAALRIEVCTPLYSTVEVSAGRC